MTLDLVNYDVKVREAVETFWETGMQLDKNK